MAGHQPVRPALDPHHDGSPQYVEVAHPGPGQRVRVRLRVPVAGSVAGVHVRVVPDGEQEFVRAERLEPAPDDPGEWWIAALTCHNPVTHYRFLLAGPPAEPDGEPTLRWLNGEGVHERDVPDAADFRLVSHPAPPDWAQDAVVYQVFPDRFARDAAVEPAAGPGAPRTDLPDWAIPAAWDDPVQGHPPDGSRQVHGGTLDGVAARLDHLVDLGVTVLYLTPFFPARSNHRYDAADFDTVDPVLGGDAALDRLIAACHERGLRIMGDITTNHTGDAHAWFRAAREDPDGEHASWYVRDPDAGSDTGGSWITWLGVPSLPKLDHRSPGLRAALIEGEDGVIRRWLRRGLDGWRVDVANMTGRYRDTDLALEVARAVRDAATAERPDALVVAEHVHDHSGDVPGDGWHGVMNYSGFADPAWAWLRRPGSSPRFLGSPVPVPRLGGGLVMRTMREFSAIVSWRALTHGMPLLGSHDTTRLATLVGGDPALTEAAVGLLLAWPGVPMLTYGDEIGMEGDFGEDGRRPMPWPAPDAAWSPGQDAVLGLYRRLVGARRGHVALRRGGLRWLHAEEDALVFVREHPEEHVLVHVARSAHADVVIPAHAVPGAQRGARVEGTAWRDPGPTWDPAVVTGPDATTSGLRLPAAGAGVTLWSWTPPGHGRWPS